jgi:PAS domain S-box-containing protein
MASVDAIADLRAAVDEAQFKELLDALPAAIYATDARGIVTYANRAAIELAGREPILGRDQWCITHRLYRPEGSPLPMDQCPMAVTLKERRPIRGVEVIAERPDGGRVSLMPHPTPLFDAAGNLVGGINMLIDISTAKQTERLLTRRMEQQAALYHFTDRLYRAESMADVQEAALDAITAALGCERASILLFDEQGVMSFVAWRGLSDGYRAAVNGHSPWKPGDRDPTPIFVRDIRETNESEALKQTIVAEGIRGLAFIPLVENGAVVGKFMTYYAEPHETTSEEAELSLTIARQLGFAIERWRAAGALEQQRGRLAALDRIARSLASNIDLEGIVQVVTDSATELSGARFGAFFYNSVDGKGEGYKLYTLSGAPRSAFDKFGLPRNTAIFDPTFRGLGTIRSDDITKDPRYGQSAPHYGMPEGHLPVVSYLAVPVVSRSGEVHGGLFFGHERPGVFTEESERIVESIAASAAVAIDNARLLQAALRNDERLRLATQAGKVGLWDWDVVADRIVWTDSIYAMHGMRPENFSATFDDWIARVHPDDRKRVETAIRDALYAGAPYEVELRSVRPDGGVTWILTTATVVRDNGRPVRMVGASVDITERKQIEQQRDLLVAELSHRVKNTLATVISIARQSFTKSRSLEEVRHSFDGRIRALAHTHGRLADANWAGVPFATIITDELKPYRHEDGSNIRLRGPEVAFSPRSAVVVGMALHELATNAAKYGALSTKSGIVDVVWDRGPAGKGLSVTWTESGGPPVSPPKVSGFGRVMIERALSSDLRGKVSLDFAPEGLRCRIELPSEALAAG